MKLSDEELNKIMMKADADLDKLKDRCHDLYDENQRLKKANEILEENWGHYMMKCGKALTVLKSIYNLDNVTITNNACDKIDEAINILRDDTDE